jgi:hypothetical protein
MDVSQFLLTYSRAFYLNRGPAAFKTTHFLWDQVCSAFKNYLCSKRKVKQRWLVLDGWPKMYYLELLLAFEGTLSCWFRLHLQSLAPNNLHWARVVGYGSFSLCVFHKEGLCPSRGDINRLIMMCAQKVVIICALHFLHAYCI